MLFRGEEVFLAASAMNVMAEYGKLPVIRGDGRELALALAAGDIAISDQFALGTPWDWVRTRASELAVQFRSAHGIKQPATLHEDELEYQEGWKERRTRLEGRFEVKPPMVFNGNGKKAARIPAKAGVRG